MKTLTACKRGRVALRTFLPVLSACLAMPIVNPVSADEIAIGGSTTVLPIVQQAAKHFSDTHPDIRFAVGGGGSSHGVTGVASDKLAIGMASRHLKDSEKEKWPDLVPTTIGQDGVAVILNSKNPVSAITKQQVQDIYTGTITNWKQLGGPDAAIVLISKEEGHSTLELFTKYFGLEAQQTGEGKSRVQVFRKQGAQDFSDVTAQCIGPNRDAIAKVSINKHAIAYVSIGTAQQVAAKGGRIRLLELDGVKATVENVANETYPLRRPLNVVTKGQPTGTVKDFIDFLAGQHGQQIVSNLEFIARN